MKMNRHLTLLAAFLVFAATITVSTTADAAPVFTGPIGYLSSNDSPYSGLGLSNFYLEDFEDGQLNTPSVSASGTWIVVGPGSLVDSVDSDDGAIDGSGAAGHSYFTNASNSAITFTFDPSALGGNLPTYVGIVLTDIGFTNSQIIGFAEAIFSIVDNLGVSTQLAPFAFGDGSTASGTAEDRFVGAFNASGISSFTLSVPTSSDWEVDHLQYGYDSRDIPEPASLLLLSLGAMAAATGRRRVSR